MFEKIREALAEEAKHYADNQKEYCKQYDSTLSNWSTKTRWNQYKAGTITRQQCEEYAGKRIDKHYTKYLENELAKVEAAENAADLDGVRVVVEWKRSSVWGMNPTATATTNATDGYNRYTGSASGCGYDKESAAIAEALNQSPAVMKMLYAAKENALALDPNATSANALDYGAGSCARPYFEGGVGTSCFTRIFEKCGYKLADSYGTKTTNYYHYVKA